MQRLLRITNKKIADNKAAIDKNAGDIATNKDNIAANKQKYC